MSQRKTMGRVMHEYAHGELKSGPRGQQRRAVRRRGEHRVVVWAFLPPMARELSRLPRRASR